MAAPEAPAWTKKKLLLAALAALFGAGLIAVIVVGVKNPDAYKSGDKASGAKPAVTPAEVKTTSAPNDSSDTVVSVPATPTTTKQQPATTPAVPVPTPKPSPFAGQQTSVAAKVAALLNGGDVDTSGVTNGDAAAALPSGSKLATFLSNMGKTTDMGALQESAKQVLGAGGGYGTPCTPGNGAELVKAVNVQMCTYISLTRNSTYQIPKGSILEITQPVVIVGNPAWRPTIDGSKTTRTFHVHPEGYLQLSFVEVFRGNEYTNGDFIYTRGGSALIDEGGGASFVGVIFNQPARSIFAADVREQLVLGGHLLVMGGQVFITGCQFFNLNPFAARFPVFFGGDELIVAGVVWETATTHTQVSGFVVGLGSGAFITILGGMGVYTGVTMTRCLAAAGAGGFGIQVGILAGIGIFTGVTINTNSALFAFWGGGGQQFLGGGVMVNTGLESIGAFGIASPVGIAPFVTVGGGIWISTGATYNVNAAIQYISVTGGLTFLGGGFANVVGTNHVRNIGLSGAYGVSGQHFQGGGNAHFVGGGNTLQTGVAGAWSLGGQNFHGGGVYTEVAMPSSRNHPLIFRAGNGNHAFVGGGAAAFVGCPDDAWSPPETTWSPPYQRRFWVMNKGAKNGDITNPGNDGGVGWPWTGAWDTGYNGKRRDLEDVQGIAVGEPNPSAPGGFVSEFERKTAALAALDAVPTALCMNNMLIGGNEADPCTGIVGFTPGTNVSSCTYYDINIDSTQCPEGSSVVAGKTARDQCTEEPGQCANLINIANRRHRKLRELEDGTHATHITRTEFMLACKSESDCASPDDLKAIVRAWLITNAQLNPHDNDLQITAVKNDFDPLVHEFLSEEQKSTDSGIPTCPFARGITVFTTTDDKAEQDKFTQLLPLLNDGQPNADLTDQLEKKNPGVCVVMSDVTLTKSFPSVKIGAFKAGVTLPEDAPGPRVVIKNLNGERVTNINAGGEYQIEIKNFLPGTALALVVSSGDDAEADPLEILDQKTAPAPYGTPMIVSWTAPEHYGGLHLFITAYSKLLPSIYASSDVCSYID